jgi:hypothetical protein
VVPSNCFVANSPSKTTTARLAGFAALFAPTAHATALCRKPPPYSSVSMRLCGLHFHLGYNSTELNPLTHLFLRTYFLCGVLCSLAAGFLVAWLCCLFGSRAAYIFVGWARAEPLTRMNLPYASSLRCKTTSSACTACQTAGLFFRWGLNGFVASEAGHTL